MEEREQTQIMTPKQAAKYLGLHVVTVYRLIKKGELPCFRVGGQWRFKKDLLDEWITASTNGKKESSE
jgi:excisionase family DNA binding protein